MKQYLTREGVPTTLEGKTCIHCHHFKADTKYTTQGAVTRYHCDLVYHKVTPLTTVCILYPREMGWTPLNLNISSP